MNTTFPLSGITFCRVSNFSIQLMFSATSQPETFPGKWDNISPYEQNKIGRRMSIQKMQLQNPLLPKRNRCTIGRKIPPKFDIFPLRDTRTAIVFVATHAQLSQTRTAHAQTIKIDSHCGVSPNSSAKTTK